MEEFDAGANVADPFNPVLNRYKARFDPEVLGASIAYWRPRVSIRQGKWSPMVDDIEYGSHPRHRMDIFPIKGSDAPIVLFVHGGGFINGDKRMNDPFYSNVGRYFASHGVVCACMNYRLAPDGGWLAGPRDVDSAVRWLLDRGDLYGGDVKQIVVVGQSAGACHVATWLLEPTFARGARDAVTAAILMSGLYLASPPLNAGQRAYFGDDVSLYDPRSPLNMVQSIPQRILVTTAQWDPAPLRDQGVAFAAELASKGGRVATLDFPNHNHVSPVMSLGSDNDSVGSALRQFIAARPS